uniref:Uncharacterized protein n=1 Tax=Oryzias sinensis TaxID=183150 RepID=A0A8C7WSK6_9TELE
VSLPSPSPASFLCKALTSGSVPNSASSSVLMQVFETYQVHLQHLTACYQPEGAMTRWCCLFVKGCHVFMAV